jgi:hypothetical protein
MADESFAINNKDKESDLGRLLKKVQIGSSHYEIAQMLSKSHPDHFVGFWKSIADGIEKHLLSFNSDHDTTTTIITIIRAKCQELCAEVNNLTKLVQLLKINDSMKDLLYMSLELSYEMLSITLFLCHVRCVIAAFCFLMM